MKILLVGVNAKYAHTNPAIRYLKNAAASEDVEIAEYTVNMPLEQVFEELLEKKASVYGFSTYIWNIEYCKKLASRLKKAGSVVLFGGPEASACSPELFECADYIIAGEGETTFRAWTSSFLKGENVKNTPSLCYQEGDSIIRNPAEQPVELDALPQPYSDLGELKGRIVYYESSRGCPFSCSYCLSSLTKGVRFSSLEKVKRDIDTFVGAGVLKVKFVDRTFNADRRRAKEIFSYIAKKGGNTGFHFEIAADLLDEETAEILGRAKKGLIQLEIGVQSTYPPALRAVHRIQDFAYTKKMVELLGRPGNVRLHLDLIAGLPYEGLIEFARSFDDVLSTGAHKVQLGFLKVLKGSEIEKDAEKYGIRYADTAPYEVLSTAAIRADELQLLRQIEYLLDRTYNSALFRETVRWFARQLGGSFSFFSQLVDFCTQNGADAAKLTEVGLAKLLYDFGKGKGIEYTEDFVKFDCLSRAFRPRLPDFLEDAHEEERRAFYRHLPEEFVISFKPGKRAWHYSRIEWFSLDLQKYLTEGDICPGDHILFFDYASGERKKLPGSSLTRAAFIEEK